MHPRIVAEFGMECSCHGASLPDGNRIATFRGDDFDFASHPRNFRCANKNHLQRTGAELAFANGAIELASIGVAADADIDRAESGLLRIFHIGGQQDCPGAGTEGGLEAHELLQLFKPLFTQQLQKSPGLAPGDHKAVDGVELLRLFDQHNFGAQFFEAAAVGIEIALQGEDSDFHNVLV